MHGQYVNDIVGGGRKLSYRRDHIDKIGSIFKTTSVISTAVDWILERREMIGTRSRQKTPGNYLEWQRKLPRTPMNVDRTDDTCSRVVIV